MISKLCLLNRRGYTHNTRTKKNKRTGKVQPLQCSPVFGVFKIDGNISPFPQKDPGRGLELEHGVRQIMQDRMRRDSYCY